MKKKLDKYLTYFKIKINTKIFEEKNILHPFMINQDLLSNIFAK